jgi:hypothetical protein
MSARKIMCLVNFFLLMIGNFVPENDEVWKLLLLFLEIIVMLLSDKLTQGFVQHLKYLINKHNSNYIKYFHDNLKPKHHLLTYYPSIILKSEPPRHFWYFRYKEFKM